MEDRVYSRAELAAELVGVAEIAEMRGSTTAAAWNVTKRPDFPEPVKRLSMGPVWLRGEVAVYNAIERRPGPKPKGDRPSDG
jgi:predicted DNA-binding transcriptional regulator AlpA